MKQRHIGNLPVLLLLAAVLFMENSCMFLPEEEKNTSFNNLVWSDEFNDSTTDEQVCPSKTNWKYETGAGGWGNQEIENYVDNSTSATTAYVSNGTLKIKAYKDGSTWKSARMNSRQSWKYGYIEAKMKVTNIKGFWPAFWMMPQDSVYGTWPASGEIDIMENAPAAENCADRIFSTLHATGHYYDNKGGKGKSIGSKTFNNLSTTWHTVAVKWTEKQITAYYDGEEQGSYGTDGTSKNYPYDQNFFIILNLAVGGQLGGSGYESYADKGAIFEVDYVRVYQ